MPIHDPIPKRPRSRSRPVVAKLLGHHHASGEHRRWYVGRRGNILCRILGTFIAAAACLLLTLVMVYLQNFKWIGAFISILASFALAVGVALVADGNRFSDIVENQRRKMRSED